MLFIYFFGHLRIFWQERPLPFHVLPKVHPLLAYLLLHRHHPTPRDTLAYLLWPDVPESEARANLRRHLHQLLRTLPKSDNTPPWILRQRQSLQWNPQAAFWLDVAEFETQSQSPTHLVEAVALYTGDLLTNLYEDFLIPERERLSNLYFLTLHQLVQRSQAEGDVKQAIAFAQKILLSDPLREDVVRHLMQLRYEHGDRAGAIREYQRFEQRLQEELGVSPLPETVDLYRAIWQQGATPSLLSVSPTPTPALAVTPRPPIRPATMLTATGVAPTRVIPPNNLTADLTPFVGRKQEVTALSRKLGAPDSAVRLLTLTGPGGIGKTRLGREVAAFLLQQHPDWFPDGIFYVALSATTEPTFVATAVANTLGIQEQGSITAPQALIQTLQAKTILLLLDNFEQVTAAATLLTDLLARAPRLRILVTSRIPLHLYGEHEYPVDPLPWPNPANLPPLAELERYPAIGLFIQVAQAVKAGFTLTAENATAVATICHRLDGIPLAIELAAARSKLFSPAAILQQLHQSLRFLTGQSRDIDQRLRTLRSTIDWSYHLLDPLEQKAITRLGVFLGSFSLTAATAVLCDPATETNGLSEAIIFDLLVSLLDKNMLRQVDTGGAAPHSPDNETDTNLNCRMLYTIREYTLEKLTQSGELAQMQQRHALYYLQLLRTLTANPLSLSQESTILTLRTAEDNIRAALNWVLQPSTSGEPVHSPILPTAIATIIDANSWWLRRGRLQELHTWYELSLTHRHHLPPDIGDNTVSRLLNRIGWLEQLQGKYTEAEQHHQEALALAQAHNDTALIVRTLELLGTSAGRQGKYDTAETILSECLEFARQNNDLTGLTILLNNLAIVLRRKGDPQRAATLLHESANIRRTVGDSFGLAANLSNLGSLALEQGQLALADQYFRECLSLRQKIADEAGLMITLQNMGQLALMQGYYIRSAQLFGTADRLRQSQGIRLTPPVKAETEQYLTRLQAQMGQSRFQTAWDTGQAMTLEQAIALASQPHATTDWTAPLPPAGQHRAMQHPLPDLFPSPPDMRFVADALIAIGGMGEVYRGHDTVTGQTVVLKRLRPELVAQNQKAITRFLREAEALRQLNHPNIVKILTSWERENEYLIIMEYVAGGSLRDLLDRPVPLPLGQILSISLELADALTRAHHLNIIHRDLKPANILLTENGSVRLTDFGIAAQSTTGGTTPGDAPPPVTRLTQSGMVMGTVSYMSPEACRGEELDTRSDIWSFGVVLYEMLTRRTPFVATQLTSTLLSILNDPIADVRQYRPDTPPALAHLLWQMLEKDRERRMSRTRQVAAALEAIQDELKSGIVGFRF